ncbi:MAG: hypothetical protein K6U02_02920 [Firmicutes bacterium]|nr:hypothetical protein [Bacillota bacterium]
MGPTLHGLGHDCACREWICFCPHDKPTQQQPVPRQHAGETSGPSCHKSQSAGERPCALSSCGKQQSDEGLLTSLPAILADLQALRAPTLASPLSVPADPRLNAMDLQKDSPPPRPHFL